jgi:hypothetical protein
MAELIVVSIASALVRNNGLVITIRDSIGREKVLNLSPGAQDQLMKSLLAGPPMSTRHKLPRGPLIAQNVRLVEVQDGETVLEVDLAHQMSVQILLPRPVLTGLQSLLAEWVSKTH